MVCKLTVHIYRLIPLGPVAEGNQKNKQYWIQIRIFVPSRQMGPLLFVFWGHCFLFLGNILLSNWTLLQWWKWRSIHLLLLPWYTQVMTRRTIHNPEMPKRRPFLVSHFLSARNILCHVFLASILAPVAQLKKYLAIASCWWPTISGDKSRPLLKYRTDTFGHPQKDWAMYSGVTLIKCKRAYTNPS